MDTLLSHMYNFESRHGRDRKTSEARGGDFLIDPLGPSRRHECSVMYTRVNKNLCNNSSEQTAPYWIRSLDLAIQFNQPTRPIFEYNI